MEKILALASHNAKKAAELKAIIKPLGFSVLTLADFPGAPEPEETGSTFEENAIIKAISAREFTGLPCLADDSGLAVDALGGAPGVYSARFAGENTNDAANNALLLAKLSGLPETLRTARFVSVIALALPGREPFLFRGECEGFILDEPRGEGGFGYDPVFFSRDLGKSFAEASGAEKNRISHRGRALAKLMEVLPGIWWKTPYSS